jgi:acetyl esterase/lipase
VVKESEVLAPYIRVPADTPPFFLVHAGDDSMSSVNHSVVMYLALKRASVPAELHVYPAGGHGFGVRKSDHPVSTWPERCAVWLRELGVLKPSTGS